MLIMEQMKDTLLKDMKDDLKNEYTHMLFYLSNAATVRGLHRLELREWLEEEASSEMEHVKEFSNLLVSLGIAPETSFHPFESLTDPVEIIRTAISLEQTVCTNYAYRIQQADYITSDKTNNLATWTRVGLFYEDQLMHSHKDLDELRQMLPLEK